MYNKNSALPVNAKLTNFRSCWIINDLMQTYRENISNNICKNIFACRHDPDKEKDNRHKTRQQAWQGTHEGHKRNKDNFIMAGVIDKEYNIFILKPRTKFIFRLLQVILIKANLKTFTWLNIAFFIIF